MICRESCNFRAYQHPTTEDRVEPYWCYQKAIVSSCPSYFKNWKLSRDCKEAVSSWIYYNDTIYRNSYCAICHLGDEIIQSSTETLSTNSPFLRKLVYNYLQHSLPQPERSDIGRVELDVNSNTCSYIGRMTNSSYKTWESINVDQTCVKLPFSTNCANSSSWFGTFPSTSLLTSSLCSELPYPLPVHPAGPGSPPQAFPVPNYNPPSYAAFFFSDIGDLPLQIVVNSSWKTVNGSAALCYNSSLIDISAGLTYSRFQLTASGIQVDF